MAKDNLTPRQIAEQRVHQRHERERARLFKERQADRRDLIARQRQEISRLDELHAKINSRRAEALATHDRQWEQERARLSSRTSIIPSFGLLGPPQRNVQKEYSERRERWQSQHEAIKERFDEQRRLVGQQRQELTERHAIHLQSHERWDRLAHDDLVRRQERSFERAVEKEQGRGARTVSRTFERHARDTGHER